MTTGTRSYAVLAKPAGPLCNLACRYCFYTEKIHLFNPNCNCKMPGNVLEAYIRQYIAMHGDVEIQFPWQGGEPTLVGLDFFRKVVAIQQKYGAGRKITNTLQTNGILLDDAWCAFLAEHNFLVGISIDGPEPLHDRFRVDRQGKATFQRVLKGITAMKQHGVRFNTLTVVHNHNAGQPREVYRFLKEIGDRFMQFIPLVEREPGEHEAASGLDWSMPPSPDGPDVEHPVSAQSVQPDAWADFYITIFDEWVRNDIGQQFIQFFDATLGNFLGAEPGICYYAETCGHAAALEHNGDVYACDHFVYPAYRLGNILETPLADLLNSQRQKEFGAAKARALPRYCQDCDVLFACHGECPKNRFLKTPDGEAGLNYLCRGYSKLFRHLAPYMQLMADQVRSGQPATGVMEIIQANEHDTPVTAAQSNDG